MTKILRFPSDIKDSKKEFPFIKFSFVKYYHKNVVIDSERFSSNIGKLTDVTANNVVDYVTETGKDTYNLFDGVFRKPQKKYLGIEIILPLPGDVGSSISPQWEMSDTRFISAIVEGGGEVRKTLQNIGSYMTTVMFEKFQQQTTARAPNPKKQALFNQIDARNFTFSWVFSPQSEREANTVHDIVKQFTTYSLPKETLNGAQYEFPAEFEISFHNIEGAPKISKCVCTGVNTNLNPSSLQLLASGHAVQTALTLSFMETDLRTQTSPGI